MDELKAFLKFIGACVLFFAALAISLALIVGLPVVIFGSMKVKEIEKDAPAFLRSHGLYVIGREGFQYGLLTQPGGCVWYTMRRKEEEQTIYHGCVSKWHDGTYELWNFNAVNAIKPD